MPFNNRSTLSLFLLLLLLFLLEGPRKGRKIDTKSENRMWRKKKNRNPNDRRLVISPPLLSLDFVRAF